MRGKRAQALRDLRNERNQKAKVNDKIRIPTNTNTTNVKSALRIRDLADRWIKQMEVNWEE